MKRKRKTPTLTPETPITAGNMLGMLSIMFAEVNRELAGWRAFAAFLKANPDVEERLAKWQEAK